MKIQLLEKTCSLAHLSHLNETINPNEETNFSFKLKLIKAIKADKNVESWAMLHLAPKFIDKKLLYVCNFPFFMRLRMRFVLGFKQSGSYIGYHKKRVYLLTYNVKKLKQ